MATEEELEAQRVLNELREQSLELKREEQRAAKELAKIERQIQADREAGKIASTDLLNTQAKLREETSGLSNEIDGTTTAIENQQRALKGLAEETEAATEAMSTLKQVGAAAAAAIPGAMGTLDSFYGTSLSRLTQGVGSAVMAVAQFANEIQGIEVNFRRTTGYQDRYVRSFNSLRGTYNKMGLTQETLEKNLLSLHGSFAAFDSLSENQRENLGLVVGRFEQLGLEGEKSAQVLDQLHFSFGLVGSSGEAAFKDLRKLSKETGLGLSVLADGITSMGGNLARFGEDAPRVFAELTKRARSLGMSVKDAFDITEQLDTFKGAAEITGRLNAQFGMQLNSVELMKASHEERVDILRQEFQLQGKSFTDLDRRQKQMLSSILGRDEGTMARLFGDQMDLGKFQEDVGKEDRFERFIKTEERVKSAEQDIFDSLVKKADKQVKKLGYGNNLAEAQILLLNKIAQSPETAGNILTGAGAASSGLGLLGSTTDMAVKGYVGYQALKGGGRLLGLTKAIPGAKGKALRALLGVLGIGTASAAPAAARTFTVGGRTLAQGSKWAARSGGIPVRASQKVAEGTGKALLKTGAKKGVGRLIPGLGLGIAGYDAMSRMGRGDFTGAGIDVLSGVAGLVPGYGTAAAIGLMGVNMARDANSLNQQGSLAGTPAGSPSSSPSGQRPTGARMELGDGSAIPIRVIIDELVVQSKLIMDGEVIDKRVENYNRQHIGPAGP